MSVRSIASTSRLSDRRAAERLEPVVIAYRGGELGGDKDSVPQRLAQSFDARDFVDHRLRGVSEPRTIYALEF
jgi:hypothetical protein